jgi:ascorbate-specific PTS system EIIC-type component UlaA
VVNTRQPKKRGINAMKTTLSLFNQYRIASIVLLLVFVISIIVVLVNQKSESNPSQNNTSPEPAAKMDKFKSGTYQPAKEIGY